MSESPDAAYTEHEIAIPISALAASVTLTLQPPEEGNTGGQINALTEIMDDDLRGVAVDQSENVYLAHGDQNFALKIGSFVNG